MAILDQRTFRPALGTFLDGELLSPEEADLVVALFAPAFPFAEALAIAESIHLRIEVGDLDTVPHEWILRSGVVTAWTAPEFHRYDYANGLSVSVISSPVAEDDFLPGAVNRPKPFVDHLGIDLCETVPGSREIYACLPDRAAAAGWRTVRQGGAGKPVRGFYCEVSEKRWVYPPDARNRPIEFGFGELQLFGGDIGGDYRPIDPGHPLAKPAPVVNGQVPRCR